jgi:hypothetical protein
MVNVVDWFLCWLRVESKVDQSLEIMIDEWIVDESECDAKERVKKECQLQA